MSIWKSKKSNTNKLVCLMPTYNKEATLEKSIESVIMQKTDFDYKLIILDDCSSDRSNEIAQKYKEKHPQQIEIVRNAVNLGLLKSIMNGYSLLKGAEYFCVLDADDWYTDDRKFSKAIKFLDAHKSYAIYMTNICIKKGNEETLLYNGKKKRLDFNFSDRVKDKAIMVQTSGVVYRNLYFKSGYNEKFEKILTSKFPESYRADGFRFEWYLQGGKAHFQNEITACYNYDMNGIWSSKTLFEQYLLNSKIMYSCAEFFPNKSSFYLNKARELFILAMKNEKDVDEKIFIKNREVVNELFCLLYEKQNKRNFHKLFRLFK